MRSDLYRTWTALGLALLLGLAGCASNGAASSTAPITVTDVSSVAGKWVGLLSITGSRDREDYVEVTVDGHGTATLYKQPPPDERMLVVNGTASDGRAYTLRLRPQR